MRPYIKLKKLEVDTIENSSGIFHGENQLTHFKGVSIHNEGFGDVTGDHNSITKTKNALIKYEQNQTHK